MKKIAVIAAMPVELEGFIRALDAKQTEAKGFYRLFEARRGECEVIFACSGIGKVNAAACTQRLIDCYAPEAIINMGIAGGIAHGLKTLDVVVGSEVVYHDFTPDTLLQKYYPFQNAFRCDEKLVELAQKVCDETLTDGSRCLVGRIASGDCFVESAAVKNRIRDELGGLCCEMEGAAIGHTAFLGGVPFLILRSISDLADEDAPMSYEEFEQKASLQANRIVLALLDSLAG